MKISYFITHFPYKNKTINERYSVGGAEAVVYNLASFLAQKGHKISIFTTSANSKSEIEECNGVTVYRYRTNIRVASGKFSLGLLKNIVKYPADLVHVHISVPIGDIAGWLCARRNKKPLVVTSHLDMGSYSGIICKPFDYLYYKLADKILSDADVIITPSEHYANEDLLRKYKEKVNVISNGINIRDFDIKYSKDECRDKIGLSANEEVMLFVGNLESRKGLDILIKAMHKIVKNTQDTKLVLIGIGSMKNGLKSLAEKLGIIEHIKFAGFVDESEKVSYYKSADIFVLPSLYEVFGIVNLEAMACGVPIVASNVGGIPDVVKDGENGLLVPPSNSEALADAIIYLLENEDVREKMGNNGREKIKDYSWGRIANETEKVYDEVLK